MKCLIFGCLLIASFILTGCENSLPEEQQRRWDSTSRLVEEEDDIWYFADGDDEIIEDEMYEKIQVYDEAGIKASSENLNYKTAVNELAALDPNSYEVLRAWLDDNGIRRLEKSFDYVNVFRVDAEQDISDEEAQGMNFTSWRFWSVEHYVINILIQYEH